MRKTSEKAKNVQTSVFTASNEYDYGLRLRLYGENETKWTKKKQKNKERI